MKLYRVPTNGSFVWYGTQIDAKHGAKEFGRDYEQVEVPVDKPGLLSWLNENTFIAGKAGQDVEIAEEPDVLVEAEQRAVRAAAPPTAPIENVQRSWDATDIEAFILERATVAQVGNIFECLGTRFKELAGASEA